MTQVFTGSNITSWNDKSGNGYHMNQLPPAAVNGPSTFPVAGTSINGQSTVYFNLTAGLKQTTLLNGAKNMYWVGRISSIGFGVDYNCYFLFGSDSTYDWHANYYSPTYTMLLTEYASSGIYNASPVSLYTGDSNAVLNTTFSNVFYPTAPSVSILSVAGLTGLTRYQGICYDRTAHCGWCGDLAEVIVFSNALTTPQHQQIEAYLSQKWGLRQQIPQSHPGTTGIVYSQQSIPKALSLPYSFTFLPTSIAGCSLWLDGADPAGTGVAPAAGSTITTWVDKSTSANTATAYGTVTVNTLVNGKLAMLTTISSGFFGYLTNSTTTATTFVVATYVNANAYNRLFAVSSGTLTEYNNPGVALFACAINGPSMGPFYNSQNVTPVTSGPITQNQPFIMTTLFTGTQCRVNLNGISTATSPVNISTSFSYTYYGIGTHANGFGSIGECWNGIIAEVIHYQAALSIENYQQVEGYLASKWGLQANLPTNHPYKSSTPDVTNARGTRRPVGLPPRSNIAFPRLKIIASIDTPSATLSSLTSTGATVTWSEISGAISYTVTIYYNSSASVTTSNLQVAQSPYTLATSGSTFTFTATDTTYYAATVTAINATAQATSSISSPVLYTAPPGQATTNTPTNTGTTLNMSWSAASGSVTAYTVYVLAGGSLAPSGTLSLGNVTSTTFSPMVSGTVYSFYVVATGPGGSGTQSTTSSTVTYTAVPVAPTSITLASLTATGATVTWSGGSGATYFSCQIYSSASSNMSSPSIISPQTPNSSTSVTTPQVFTFSVTAGLYYGAIITAVNAGGSTSSVMSTGVLYSVAEPPVAPTTVTLASLTGSGATVTWSGGSGATYYTCQIYSSAASNMSSPTTISQSPSSSSSVSSGQVFSFSVEDSLYYGAIVTTVNASGSAASSMSTGVQFVGTYSGLGPVTTLATGFGNLYNLAIDSAENIYLADYGGHKVWYIPSGGSPSIFAGSTSGYLDGAAGSAKFNGPSGVAVSSDGATVYVTDYGSSKIRKINGGTVTTLAGGTHGAWVDGASNVARFFYPSGIAIDRTETVLFIGDKLTHRIRVVTIATGAVTTLAGGASSSVGGSGAYADGTGSNASFNSPLGVCVGLDNSVYVADSANHRIRKVTYPEGVVTTVAGSGVGGFSNALGTTARFLYPYGLAMDSYGILYVADKDNKRIRQITASGNVTTFAGTGTNTNVDNANRLLATFVQPTGVVVNSSRTSLYVTQTVTPAVRKITLS
jgi:hypothetical protein